MMSMPAHTDPAYRILSSPQRISHSSAPSRILTRFRRRFPREFLHRALLSSHKPLQQNPFLLIFLESPLAQSV